MIHGLDITVQLGLPFAVPEDRLRRVLPASADSKSVRYFGTELSGIETFALPTWTGPSAPVSR